MFRQLVIPHFTWFIESSATQVTSMLVVSSVFIHVIPQTILCDKLSATHFTVVVKSFVLPHVVPIPHRTCEAFTTRITPQRVLT